MTALDYYTHLRATCRRGGTLWTCETIVEAFRLFIDVQGTWPTHNDLSPTCGLPTQSVLRRRYGSLEAFRVGYERAHGAVPSVAPILHHRRRLTSYAARVRCLRCERWWDSPDRRVQRICPACREVEHWQEGAWMNGTLVLSHDFEDVDEDVLAPSLFVGVLAEKARKP